MSNGASLSGRALVIDRLRNISKNLPKLVGAALYTEASVEAKEAKRRTPVDRGTLRGTIHVTPPVLGTNIYVMIVAGGPSAPYAVYVHEDLDAFHKVGQAKFLESVILESRPFMAQRIARRLELRKLL